MITKSLLRSNFAKFLRLSAINKNTRLMSCSPRVVLGLESTCDDTGVALVNEDGDVLGESLRKQVTSPLGGVIPSMSMAWHAQNFPLALTEVCKNAKIDEEELSQIVAAIAVANRPGLKGGLVIGTDFAKYLSTKHRLPVVSVHHMQAHALTARMSCKDLKFPFLVLLASGGHCLIAIARGVEEFKILGSTQDNSPGEVLDKAARSLRLHDLRPDLKDLAGGKAVEIVANENGDPLAFNFHGHIILKKDCRFSFSGFRSKFDLILKEMDQTHVYELDELLPRTNDICASLLHSLITLICNRVQRALRYAELEQIWNENDVKTLVASGGVLSNGLLRRALEKVGQEYDCRIVFPPSTYCTDNGAMIAWNGVEKLRSSSDCIISHEEVFSKLDVTPKLPLGQDISEEVALAKIKVDRNLDFTKI